MKIEAVITCVKYGDFLAASLPTTKPVFDRLVVATTPDDLETRKVCEAWNVECVKTDAFHQGGPFCKGRGINVGLARLSLTDWVCHLDADIALPPRAREMLQRGMSDPSEIYGIDRTMCPSWDAWQRSLASITPQHAEQVWIQPGPFPLGCRFQRPEDGGYLPIGFFQLWNAKASGITRYAEGHGDAAREDTIFSGQWPRAKRHLIPELLAVHLESEAAPMGANWKGRKTVRFGPPPLISTTSDHHEPLAVSQISPGPTPAGPPPIDPKVVAAVEAAILAAMSSVPGKGATFKDWVVWVILLVGGLLGGHVLTPTEQPPPVGPAPGKGRPVEPTRAEIAPETPVSTAHRFVSDAEIGQLQATVARLQRELEEVQAALDLAAERTTGERGRVRAGSP